MMVRIPAMVLEGKSAEYWKSGIDIKKLLSYGTARDIMLDADIPAYDLY